MTDTEGGPHLPPDWPEESAQRLAKAQRLRELGVDPYPTRYERTHTLGTVVATWGERTIEELAALATPVRIAGRVLTKRGHGKASFATLSDGDARLQIYVRAEDVGPRGYGIFDLLDLGDFVGVAGTVMRTRKGELSVQAGELTFLSKALLPPPEKWHGLADVETRYRQRYVDLIANEEVRRTFVARSAMVAEMRRFFDARGYIAVDRQMRVPLHECALGACHTLLVVTAECVARGAAHPSEVVSADRRLTVRGDKQRVTVPDRDSAVVANAHVEVTFGAKMYLFRPGAIFERELVEAVALG